MRFSRFHQVTANQPADPLLDRFFALHPETSGKAIDVGCGSGRDSLELLRRGWEVTAVDSSEEALSLLRAKLSLENHSRIQILRAGFESLELEKNRYDLAYSAWALPFCQPGRWEIFWGALVDSLAPNGYLAAHFFGPRDDFAQWDPGAMTFHSLPDVRDLFSRFSVEHIREEERRMHSKTGAEKHWHVISVIGRKAADSRSRKDSQP